MVDDYDSNYAYDPENEAYQLKKRLQAMIYQQERPPSESASVAAASTEVKDIIKSCLQVEDMATLLKSGNNKKSRDLLYHSPPRVVAPLPKP